MFKRRSPPQVNHSKHIPAATGGFDPSSILSGMKQSHAPVLDNWFPQPDGLETRDGYLTHITAIPSKVDRLHVYADPDGTESLWGTTNDGIYNFTTAGVCPAASIALTNGRTFSTSISTGAGSYMQVCNGTDTIKQYDGAAWSSIAVFGAQATDVYSYIETYRQRIFLARKQSTEIEYLAANSIAGAATNYPLGAIFRKGGYIVALAVWTIDGGIGPEDNLVVLTNKGEVAVFAGNDPATWSLRGVYFAGIPMGDNPTYKHGGDVLIITEGGIIPLSSLLQNAAIERVQTISTQIRPFLIDRAAQFSTAQGWQIIGDPSKPFIAVNLPSTIRQQAVQNLQTGAWCTYTGWNALCFGRRASELYFGDSEGAANEWVVKRITGHSDDNTNIVATALQAYSQWGFGGNKKVEEIKAVFNSTGAFQYNYGISNDFAAQGQTTELNVTTGFTAAIWGTGLWGTATWTGGDVLTYEWQTVPDEYAEFKALYVQVTSRLGAVQYSGATVLFKDGGHF
jgi:hypothetical protein